MVAHATPRPLTRAEYDRMAELGFFAGERVELIHGTVVRMAPIGPSHCDVVDAFTEIFVSALARRATVRIQQPFLAWDDSEPEPDIAIVPRKRYADRHPEVALLIVEVAESSLDYDRAAKAPLYAASGVAEYWIVDVAARVLEVYAAPSGGRYTRVVRVGVEASIHPEAFADVEIHVSALFG